MAVEIALESIEAANRTARSGGAIGPHALVPRHVEQSARQGEMILDFGAGPEARHTLRLRALGLDVTAHEFGANVRMGVHDPAALDRRYDTVMASNVANVQSSPEMLSWTLDQMAGAVAPGGRLVINLPESPRPPWLTPADLEDALRERFATVRRVGGTRQAPLYEASGPLTGEARGMTLADNAICRMRQAGIPRPNAGPGTTSAAQVESVYSKTGGGGMAELDARIAALEHEVQALHERMGGTSAAREPENTPEDMVAVLANDYPVPGRDVTDWLGAAAGAGFVFDAGQARTTPCIRVELPERGPLVFSRGIHGPLDDEQQALYCQEGYQEYRPEPTHLERLVALHDASMACGSELRPVADLPSFFGCLGRELRARGIEP